MFDEIFAICPLSSSLHDREAHEIIGIIEMCEGGESGSSTRSPTALLEEPNFYFNVRSIVQNEKGRIWRLKEKKEK